MRLSVLAVRDLFARARGSAPSLVFLDEVDAQPLPGTEGATRPFWSPDSRFLGFIAGWTEYYFSVIFLSEANQFTLAVALNGMVGQFATTTPWAEFSAFAIMFALPVSVVYLLLQKYIIGGLAIGGVKG